MHRGHGRRNRWVGRSPAGHVRRSVQAYERKPHARKREAVTRRGHQCERTGPAYTFSRRLTEILDSGRVAIWRGRDTLSYCNSRSIDALCFKRAAGLFREIAVPFYLAVTQLEHSEWLVGEGRASEAEPLLAEAHEIFERLEATPWLERAQKVGGAAKIPA